jgi:hypothetical protein
MSSSLSSVQSRWTRYLTVAEVAPDDLSRFNLKVGSDTLLDAAFIAEKNADTIVPTQVLLLGQFTIATALDVPELPAETSSLDITLVVDGKAYLLPINIRISISAGTVTASLGTAVPFTIIDRLLQVDVLGFTATRIGTVYTPSLSGPVGTNLSGFLACRVITTPSASYPPSTTTSSATTSDGQSEQCSNLSGVDLTVPVPPEVPGSVVVPPIPILPCDIEIPDIPPIDLPILPPALPPGASVLPEGGGGSGGGGSGGCTPVITYSYGYAKGCERPVDMQVYRYGRCSQHIHFIYYRCPANHGCCVYVWCDGEWKLKSDDTGVAGPPEDDSEYVGGVSYRSNLSELESTKHDECCTGEVYYVTTNFVPDLPPCWQISGEAGAEAGSVLVLEGCTFSGGQNIIDQAEGSTALTAYGVFIGEYADLSFSINREKPVPDCACETTTTAPPTTTSSCVPPESDGQYPGQSITVCDCTETTSTTTAPPDCCTDSTFWLTTTDTPPEPPHCWVVLGSFPEGENTVTIFEGCTPEGIDKLSLAVEVRSSGTGIYIERSVFDRTGQETNCECTTTTTSTSTTSTTTTAPPDCCTSEFYHAVVPLGESLAMGELPPCWVYRGYFSDESDAVFEVYEGCTEEGLDFILSESPSASTGALQFTLPENFVEVAPTPNCECTTTTSTTTAEPNCCTGEYFHAVVPLVEATFPPPCWVYRGWFRDEFNARFELYEGCTEEGMAEIAARAPSGFNGEGPYDPSLAFSGAVLNESSPPPDCSCSSTTSTTTSTTTPTGLVWECRNGECVEVPFAEAVTDYNSLEECQEVCI